MLLHVNPATVARLRIEWSLQHQNHDIVVHVHGVIMLIWTDKNVARAVPFMTQKCRAPG